MTGEATARGRPRGASQRARCLLARRAESARLGRAQGKSAAGAKVAQLRSLRRRQELKKGGAARARRARARPAREAEGLLGEATGSQKREAMKPQVLREAAQKERRVKAAARGRARSPGRGRGTASPPPGSKQAAAERSKSKQARQRCSRGGRATLLERRGRQLLAKLGRGGGQLAAGASASPPPGEGCLARRAAQAAPSEALWPIER